MIDIYIPYIYTDGFLQYKKYVLNSISKLPKIIFTCIGYQQNESLKIISAESIEKGGKLLISQHGGNFGLAKFNQMEEHQIKVADKFFTWGWGNKKDKTFPFFSIQLSSDCKFKPKFDRKPKIINVMASSPRYFYSLFSLALGPEYENYLLKQKLLANRLKPSISNNIFHRFNGHTFGWSADKRLNDIGLKPAVHQKTYKELNNYALCISSYNATVALQTLSKNYPTILYWPKEILR